MGKWIRKHYRCRGLLEGVLISAALTGCEPTFQAPNLYALDKEWIDNDQEHTILLFGDSFYPQIQVTNDAELQVNQQFRAWLISEDAQVELSVSPHDGYESLSAVVPAGLEPARYDILLHTPTGKADQLKEGLLIVETAADSIAFDPVSTVYPTDTTVTIDLGVLNTEGEPLDQDFPIVITVTSDDGVVLFESGGLDEQRSLSDGEGIQGVLQSGAGSFSFRVPEPGQYTFTATPSGEVPFLTRDNVVGSMSLSFAPADIEDLTLVLADSSVTAGDELTASLTLLGADGAPSTYPLPLTFWVTEQCGNTQGQFNTVVTLPSATESIDLVVQPEVASGTRSCAENGLSATLINTEDAGDQSLGTSSAALSVVAGDPASLSVIATYSDEVTAGEQARIALAVQDAYANPVIPTTATPSFLGSQEGSTTGRCSAWSEGQSLCEVDLYRAGEGVTVTATVDGFSATSAPFLVLAGLPDVVTLYTDSNTTQAGQPRPFYLSLFDAYDNPAPVPVGAAAPRFTQGSDVVACEQASETVGNAAFDCMLTRAGEDIVLDVVVGDVLASSPPFSVINGDVAHVAISPPSALVAGETFSVSLAATDAYGNPFIETLGGSAIVELYDDSGDLSEQVELSEGQAVLSSLQLTTAWDDNTLSVYQGGLWLGQSEVFDVDVDDVSGFDVHTEQGWIPLGEALDVTVSAIDDYGNVVEDYTPTSGGVRLYADASSGEALTLRSFTDGSAETSFVFDTVALSEQLVAELGALSGESSALDAVTGGCASPPTAALTVDGSAPATLCLSSGTTDRVDLSARGSSAGADALSVWHFNDAVTGWSRSLTNIATADWAREGQYLTEVVVVDASGCYDTTSALVYVSEDNGAPAGPVSIVADGTSLSANTSGSAGSVTLSIAASDCSGATAGGESLYVRADIGELLSGTTSVSSAGSGLFVTLDAYGEAEISWDTGVQAHAGLSGVAYVGRDDAAAAGNISLPIVGDAALPYITGVSPAGSFTAKTDTLTFTFSEPVDDETVSDSTVSLLDPDDMPVSILDYTVDGGTVVVTLADELDPGDGAWTVLIDDGVTDLDGNRLSGDYSGTAADFSLALGGVSDNAPALSTCTSDVSFFRPDGDDGPGSDADEVELSFSADSAASWWRIEIADAGGAVVRTVYRDAASTSRGSWLWDGRGDDGLILENAAYTITVDALDDSWNAGAACATTVSIDNVL